MLNSHHLGRPLSMIFPRIRFPALTPPSHFQPFPTPHSTKGSIVVASTHQVKQEKVFQHYKSYIVYIFWRCIRNVCHFPLWLPADRRRSSVEKVCTDTSRWLNGMRPHLLLREIMNHCQANKSSGREGNYRRRKNTNLTVSVCVWEHTRRKKRVHAALEEGWMSSSPC